MTLRRLPRPTPRTALQTWSQAFGDLVHGARENLGAREYEVFLDVLATRIAREIAAMLDREPRP